MKKFLRHLYDRWMFNKAIKRMFKRQAQLEKEHPELFPLPPVHYNCRHMLRVITTNEGE